MKKNGINSISGEELAILQREIFYVPSLKNYREHGNDPSCPEAGDILRKLSVEEVFTLIDDLNYRNCGWLAPYYGEDVAEKVHAAQELYAKNEVEKFIAKYNSGKVVEYLAKKRHRSISLLRGFLDDAYKMLPEDSDTSIFDNYYGLLDEVLDDFAVYDFDSWSRPSYKKLKKLAVECGYYTFAAVDDDAICEYLIAENGVRSKCDSAVLSEGKGFKEIAETESIDNKVLMAVDFAVNFGKTQGFLYDDALDTFVDDFLSTEILESSILGMPVKQVIEESAPYVYFRFYERHNSVPYDKFNDRGDLVKLNILSEMFSENVESKRDCFLSPVTPSTK